MKKTFFIILTLLLVINMVQRSDSEEQNDYRILKVGQFHGKEVDPVSNQNWFGLFKTDFGFNLKQVRIRDSKCFDPVLDKIGDTTGVQIDIILRVKPIVLIQNKNLEENLIPTSVRNQISIEPGKRESLGFYNGIKYSIVALGEITDEGYREPGDLIIKNYTLKLITSKDSKRKDQILILYSRLSYDGLPSLLWSGDLDNDGKLDLLLDITNHYNITHYALYLSSEAVGNDVLKLVAEFRITGC